ncbi:MAG: CDP-diacylglycerol--glycerol-3-phosphate 3-phosphatidyltransferase [Coriobacteriia bacterium]|nr:CDP-diacylglycerol--glycerol-3-phosphate 3-phosphatidyltransferase [Coriobacteriia bacterium]
MTQEEKQHAQILTPANIVTTIRIALIPVFVAVILAPWPSWAPDVTISLMLEDAKPIIAALVFALLALTDSVDGYLARSRNEVTTLGKFLDPLADKILVAAALLALIDLGLLPAWIALVIIGREFLVSGLRMVASAEGVVIAASKLGKSKTIVQIIAVLLFIIKESWMVNILISPIPLVVDVVSWLVMTAALVLTILSGADYFIKSSALLSRPFKKPAEVGAASPVLEDVSPPALDDSSDVGVDPVAAGSDRIAAAGSDRIAAAAAAVDNSAPDPASVTSTSDPARVINLARARGYTIGTAESCTGGLVAAALTDVPGASDVFRGAVVSYANEVKEALLGVSHQILETVGAVSSQTACAMALGALSTLGVDMAVSVTGIAGPQGGSREKPVGTVWFARACRGDTIEALKAEMHLFCGDREGVRSQATAQALRLFIEGLSAE